MEYLQTYFKSLTWKHAYLCLPLLVVVLLLSFAFKKGVLSQVLVMVVFIALSISAVAGGWFAYTRFYKSSKKLTIRAFNQSLTRRIQQLKSMGFYKGFWRQSSVQTIPKFILLGSQSVGKTQFLRQSGIYFSTLGSDKSPLANQDIDQQCHCNWWFANEAVVIEASGWFVDSDASSDTWLNLAAKLKRMNAKQAFQGILLVISCQTVLNETVLPEHIDLIRLRIDQLYKRIGIRIPVHLIINQCDHLPGFNSFFLHLNKDAAQHVWGVEFDDHKSITKQFFVKSTDLYQRLVRRLINEVHLQQETMGKLQALQFPQQFYSLNKALQKGIEQLCQETHYQEKIRLLGVYFTSASDVQSLTSDKKNNLFVHDLLKKRIFTQTPPAVFCQRKSYHQSWLNRLKMASIGLSFVALLSMVCFAYLINSKLLSNGKELAATVGQQFKHQHTLSSKLSLLDAVGKHVYELRHFKEQHPWYHKLGMVRTESQRDIYETMFANGLDHDFYQPIKAFLGQELERMHNNWVLAQESERMAMRGDYYATLKLYLMLHFPKHIELDFASNQLTHNWRKIQVKEHKVNPLSLNAVKEISRTYLDYLSTLNSMPALSSTEQRRIKLARHDLVTTSGISNYYALTKNQFISQLGFLSYDQFFEDSGADVWFSHYKLPCFFTRKAFKQFIEGSFATVSQTNPHHDWVIHAHFAHLADSKSKPAVLTDSSQKKRLLNELNTLYLNDYLNEWINFIGSIKTSPFRSTDDASQQLRVLYNPMGPFKQLFSILQHNLDLEKVLDKDTLEALPSTLRLRFTELETFSSSIKNQALTNYMKQLEGLQQDIERLSIGTDLAHASEHYATRLLQEQGHDSELYKTSALVDNLSNDINGLASRQAIKLLLLSPVQETYRAMVNEALRGLQQEWEQSVLQPFNQRLSSYFPFDRHGQDVNLAEFIAFFKPGQGVFARFMKRIEPFINREGERYSAKKWLSVDTPFSSIFLERVKDIHDIAQSLFPQGGGELSLRYAIFPIPTPGIKEILFSSNSQSYPYRNGPQEWVHFNWPAQDTMDNETVVRITRTYADSQSSKEYQGVWGLFHLLQSAERISKTDKGYKIEWLFKQGGDSKTVHLLLAAKTQADPFKALLFKPITLPHQIVSGD